jgi:hypothetical protein
MKKIIKNNSSTNGLSTTQNSFLDHEVPPAELSTSLKRLQKLGVVS